MRIYLKTWRCDVCGYSLDVEPTAENYAGLGFEKTGLRALTAYECPSCRLRGTVGQMVEEVDPALLTRVDLPGDAEIAARKIDSGNRRGDGTKILRGLTPNEISARKRERDTWVDGIRGKIHSIEDE